MVFHAIVEVAIVVIVDVVAITAVFGMLPSAVFLACRLLNGLIYAECARLFHNLLLYFIIVVLVLHQTENNISTIFFFVHCFDFDVFIESFSQPLLISFIIILFIVTDDILFVGVLLRICINVILSLINFAHYGFKRCKIWLMNNNWIEDGQHLNAHCKCSEAFSSGGIKLSPGSLLFAQAASHKVLHSQSSACNNDIDE